MGELASGAPLTQYGPSRWPSPVFWLSPWASGKHSPIHCCLCSPVLSVTALRDMSLIGTHLSLHAQPQLGTGFGIYRYWDWYEKTSKGSFPIWHSSLGSFPTLIPSQAANTSAIPRIPPRHLGHPLTFLIGLHYLFQLVLGPRSQDLNDDPFFGS